MSYARVSTRRALGADCGPCTIQSGSDCEICPDDAGPDFPECNACMNGARSSLVSTVTQSNIVAPVVVGVITTLIGVWVTSRLMRD